MIQIQTIDATTYRVTVHAEVPTVHTVTLRPADLAHLAGPQADPHHLIEVTFEFLLERGPNTAILRVFELPVISQFYPDYLREIRKRL